MSRESRDIKKLKIIVQKVDVQTVYEMPEGIYTLIHNLMNKGAIINFDAVYKNLNPKFKKQINVTSEPMVLPGQMQLPLTSVTIDMRN